MTPGRQRSVPPLAASRQIAPTRRFTLAPSHRSLRGRVRAFTLIEMMIVVGIIVLLAALTLTVVTTLTAKAETSQVENTFKLLEMALQNWEESSSRAISYGIDGTPPTAVYDVQQSASPPTLPDPTIDEFLPTRALIAIIRSNPSAAEILAKVDTDMLREGRPLSAPNAALLTTIIDPWDKEVMVVFPGRLWVGPNQIPGYAGDPPGEKDPDGTMHTLVEHAYGKCVNRKIRFVSSGPDGRFGDLRAAAGSPDANAVSDNIYSNALP